MIMTTARSIGRALAAAALVAVGGCADHRQVPLHTEPPPSQARGPSADPNATSIQVDPEIARKCQLPEAHFAFDSSRVSNTDSPALDSLARCFTKGPLRGRAMKIVGHADPRGELEYNFALGQRRAGSVADYLAHRGMSEGKIRTSSRGELEASGSNDEGWARDRRVEVLLAD
jgi:peptidoglycan-associated lipoprotein